MGMFNIAIRLAPQIAKKVDMSDKKNLLDLGGGPGTYAIHFCINNPDLKATIYDLPTTKPHAIKTIEKFGLSSRISFVPGNYINDKVPGNYDVAWLSHILHSEGKEECEKIIAKVVDSLTNGGKIFIHDFILNEDRTSPLFPTLFSLNMLVNTNNGQSYSESEIIGMLKKAGVKKIKRLKFKSSMESGIISGVVEK